MITEQEIEQIARERKEALRHLVKALEDYHQDILHNIKEMERLTHIIEEMARKNREWKMPVTEPEIEQASSDHKKAVELLIQAIDKIPPINKEPCWIQRVFRLEPTILLEKHKLD